MDFPAGVNFRTGRAARSRRSLEEKLVSLLADAGFEEIITPVIEYYGPSSGPGENEWIYRFPDQLTGRMLALRSDFTLQIARFAAARATPEPLVRRWCYRGNVFRAVREHAGDQRQIYQVGAELLGDGSLDSTARMVSLSVDLIRACGLEDFSLVVGHVGFVEHLLRMAGLPPGREGELRGILMRKDLSGLARLAVAESLPKQRVEALRSAMYLIGGAKTLEEAERVVGEGLEPGIMADLRGIHREAAAARGHLLFDLTEPRGFEYYTGIMFQVVVPTIGQEVCRGGRYDGLLERFGQGSPAVGFAVDLDLVLQAVGQHGRYRRGNGT